MAKLKVALCGGGTGGHYYPILAVAQRLSEKFDTEFLYFTIAGRLDDKRVDQDFAEVKKIPLNVHGLIRPIYKPSNVGIVIKHLMQTRIVKKELQEFRPDFLFSSGGYISFPVVLAASKLNIPIYLHEQNALPGMANKKLAKYATAIFVSFKESIEKFGKFSHKARFTGNPVRRVYKNREEVFEELKFDMSKPLIVVMGGSQGSSFINKKMLELYELINSDKHDFQFLHITGRGEDPQKFEKYSFVKTFEYIYDLHEYVAKADLVISRGGATSIAEIVNYNRRAIVIPWNGAAENHQYHNAVILEKLGLGCVILEDAVTAELLLSRIVNSLSRKTSTIHVLKEPVELIIENIIREESR
ncbi:hypothetical protein AT15_07930 [Kosmotoga arenicorallina S304]|uniref:UDP-N-acetylglucosamine--N-acetylmuramyl-(pentapeptide) pyrophosphoryl-undecaprenol N-acetylglucosamine transferase n=1 Tax=Kosmotoga arenicorallina S304 TaxID=1453497 RepID=A0A182C7A6_9BACT|nr:UDP-N-acetylglucosamine--N-acetylmuramyl-(pentapeptide) pyrophosphoryl-undecaprenol N-acetylglucosamine transferase [Kosmotoga arenicorallina]OAA31415.1 hypothetical protein AT15_07930 [Kosmotoga arenicorallina S304]